MNTQPLPTAEQTQRAKWDLLLADLEYRQEQLRQSRQQVALLPWQVVMQSILAAAALVAAGVALGRFLFGT